MSLPVGGLLPSSIETVFIVPPQREVETFSITLVNTTAGAITVNMWVSGFGSAQRILGKDYSIAASGIFVDDTHHYLTGGSVLQGDASASGVVSFMITGKVI